MILLPNPSRHIGQLPEPPQLFPITACRRIDDREPTVSNDANVEQHLTHQVVTIRSVSAGPLRDS